MLSTARAETSVRVSMYDEDEALQPFFALIVDSVYSTGSASGVFLDQDTASIAAGGTGATLIHHSGQATRSGFVSLESHNGWATEVNEGDYKLYINHSTNNAVMRCFDSGSEASCIYANAGIVLGGTSLWVSPDASKEPGYELQQNITMTDEALSYCIHNDLPVLLRKTISIAIEEFQRVLSIHIRWSCDSDGEDGETWLVLDTQLHQDVSNTGECYRNYNRRFISEIPVERAAKFRISYFQD